jgi:hypothetical protein
MRVADAQHVLSAAQEALERAEAEVARLQD